MSLNPRIKQITLGIEEEKEYTIYPLSMASEFKLIDMVVETAGNIANVSEAPDMQVAQVGVSAIRDNIVPILELVTKPDNRPTLEDIDNVQFTELVDLIYEMNFGAALKNVQSLVQKVKKMFPSTRQSRGSLDLPVTE